MALNTDNSFFLIPWSPAAGLLIVDDRSYQAVRSAAKTQAVNPLPRTVKRETFTLALSGRAKILGGDFFERQKPKIGASPVVSHKNLYQIRPQQDLAIGWDESCVIRTDSEIRPYTLGLDCCIGILMRGFSTSNRDYPTHLSVTHVFLKKGIEEFHNSLEDMIQKTQRVEIFLCGGFNPLPTKSRLEQEGGVWEVSNAQYKEILAEAKKPNVFIAQDLVGLAHAKGKQYLSDTWRPNFFSFRIGKTGFDENCNPYAVVDVYGDCRQALQFDGPGEWEAF